MSQTVYFPCAKKIGTKLRKIRKSLQSKSCKALKTGDIGLLRMTLHSHIWYGNLVRAWKICVDHLGKHQCLVCRRSFHSGQRIRPEVIALYLPTSPGIVLSKRIVKVALTVTTLNQASLPSEFWFGSLLGWYHACVMCKTYTSKRSLNLTMFIIDATSEFNSVLFSVPAIWMFALHPDDPDAC